MLRVKDYLDQQMAIRYIRCTKHKCDSDGLPVPEEIQEAYDWLQQLDKLKGIERQCADKLYHEAPDEYDRYVENLIQRHPILTLANEVHRIMEKNLGKEQAEKFMKRNGLLSESHFGSEKFNKNYRMPEPISRRRRRRKAIRG